MTAQDVATAANEGLGLYVELRNDSISRSQAARFGNRNFHTQEYIDSYKVRTPFHLREAMRVPVQQTSDANAIEISSSSTLRITLAFSTNTIPYKPIVLPNGTISTSPPYHSTASQPAFIPYRPTFEPPSTTQAARSGSKGRQRHAALFAHLSAELREDGGSWEDVVRECRMGRGGYNAPC
ncbi:hypothetical protein N0V91_009639 [Didymella pomorum]|uniref:Uncharacterized protein n=1 Tax=Didymella pomorum TaxID=749634 RepID=A0A9W8Z6V4_9PLEO|nr:hypothetical protein N0V91_009639 [Didymella pomorum]